VEINGEFNESDRIAIPYRTHVFSGYKSLFVRLGNKWIYLPKPKIVSQYLYDVFVALLKHNKTLMFLQSKIKLYHQAIQYCPIEYRFKMELQNSALVLNFHYCMLGFTLLFCMNKDTELICAVSFVTQDLSAYFKHPLCNVTTQIVYKDMSISQYAFKNISLISHLL